MKPSGCTATTLPAWAPKPTWQITERPYQTRKHSNEYSLLLSHSPSSHLGRPGSHPACRHLPPLSIVLLHGKSLPCPDTELAARCPCAMVVCVSRPEQALSSTARGAAGWGSAGLCSSGYKEQSWQCQHKQGQHICLQPTYSYWSLSMSTDFYLSAGFLATWGEEFSALQSHSLAEVPATFIVLIMMSPWLCPCMAKVISNPQGKVPGSGSQWWWIITNNHLSCSPPRTTAMSRKTSRGKNPFLAMAQLNWISNRFEGCSDLWSLRKLQKCYCFPYIAAYIHYPKFLFPNILVTQTIFRAVMRQSNPWFTTNMAFGEGFSLTKQNSPSPKQEQRFSLLIIFFITNDGKTKVRVLRN